MASIIVSILIIFVAIRVDFTVRTNVVDVAEQKTIKNAIVSYQMVIAG